MGQPSAVAAGLSMLSFIRTMTVGSGLSPDLLTLRRTEGARGLVALRHIPPVGNSAPP